MKQPIQTWASTTGSAGSDWSPDVSHQEKIKLKTALNINVAPDIIPTKQFVKSKAYGNWTVAENSNSTPSILRPRFA